MGVRRLYKIIVFLLFICLSLATYKPAFSVSDNQNYSYINNAQWLMVGNNFYLDIESITWGTDISTVGVTTKGDVSKENIRVKDTEVYTEIYFDVYDLKKYTFYTTYILYFDKKGQLITFDLFPFGEEIRIEPDTGFDNVATILKDIYYHPKNINNYYAHIMLKLPYSKYLTVETDPYATLKEKEQKTKDLKELLNKKGISTK